MFVTDEFPRLDPENPYDVTWGLSVVSGMLGLAYTGVYLSFGRTFDGKMKKCIAVIGTLCENLLSLEKKGITVPPNHPMLERSIENLEKIRGWMMSDGFDPSGPSVLSSYIDKLVALRRRISCLTAEGKL